MSYLIINLVYTYNSYYVRLRILSTIVATIINTSYVLVFKLAYSLILIVIEVYRVLSLGSVLIAI
jgi:hypothetical protein